MELKSDFETFLSDIRLTDNQKKELREGHARLRKRLNEFAELQTVFVSDFLQGSYRRHTAIRAKNGKRSDVDIILVTKLNEGEYLPDEAMDLFVPFLDKYYEGKWRRQGRSIGIELSSVEFDLVITSAPSESEIGIFKTDAVTTDESIVKAFDWRLHPDWISLDHRLDFQESYVSLHLAKAKEEPEWKIKPLRIPNRDANCWEDTHPLEQIKWTREKNKATNTYFVNVVKAIKWWRLINYAEPKHPKGFPLERIIGDCCPDGIGSVAEGIVGTLEGIVSQYKVFIDNMKKPVLADYGVPTHDVLGRLSVDDFLDFYAQAKEGAELARRAFESQDRTESGNLWRELLGNSFPKPLSGSNVQKGYTLPTASAAPGSGRFA